MINSRLPSLLHFLLNESDNLKIKVIVTHINHCLRGEESDRDEKFVSDFVTIDDVCSCGVTAIWSGVGSGKNGFIEGVHEEIKNNDGTTTNINVVGLAEKYRVLLITSRKAKVTENVEYYSVNRAIKTLDKCDIVFLMIDAQEGLAEQDKKICSLAYEQGRGIIFVLNKWDTQEKGRTPIKKAEQNIRIMFGHMNYSPILCISALEGEGIKLLLDTALELYSQVTKKVSTSVLNTALKDWLFKYPPPASKTSQFKIRYMVQTSTNPVKFVIFATRPEVVPLTYISFLKNRIREDLGFDKIPVQRELKASRKKWEDRDFE